jgi:hypothetical protein
MSSHYFLGDSPMVFSRKSPKSSLTFRARSAACWPPSCRSAAAWMPWGTRCATDDWERLRRRLMGNGWSKTITYYIYIDIVYIYIDIVYIYIRHGLLATKLWGADLEARWWYKCRCRLVGSWFSLFSPRQVEPTLGEDMGFRRSQEATFSPFQQHVRFRPALVSCYPRITALWVCLKIVYPFLPNGFHDHYPY